MHALTVLFFLGWHMRCTCDSALSST